MFKIKIIHYQTYEFQLLQELLNDLSNQGYHCQRLSFFTIFKKTNEKSHYVVDLFSSHALSHYDKNIEKERFIDPYLEYDYHLLYQRKELFVFKGTNKIPDQAKPKAKCLVTDKSLRTSSLWSLCLIVLTSLFLYFSLRSFRFDSFLTYGSLFIYIALIGMLMGITYQKFAQYYYNTRLQKGTLQYNKNIFKKKHQLLQVFMSICFCLMIGGLIEDTFNPQELSLQDHPQITLKDLTHSDDTTTSYTKKTGFFIPQYYHYLETSKDQQDVLLVKEYHYSHENKATQVFTKITSDKTILHLDDFSYDGLKQYSNCIQFGILNNQCQTIILKNKTNVYIVSSNHAFTAKQKQLIIEYYLK